MENGWRHRQYTKDIGNTNKHVPRSASLIKGNASQNHRGISIRSPEWLKFKSKNSEDWKKNVPGDKLSMSRGESVEAPTNVGSSVWLGREVRDESTLGQ